MAKAKGPFTITNPNKDLLKELGFECFEEIGSGLYGIVYVGVCNNAAFKRYPVSGWAAGRQVGEKVVTESTPKGIKYFIEKSLAGKKCAIKVVSETRVAQTIRDEILSNISVSHPNCVETYGIVREKECGLNYLIMEFLNGKDFKEFLQEFDGRIKRIDERQAIEMMRQMLRGLNYLHTSGIVHGDVHSGNLRYNISQTTGYQWKYLDFGMAVLGHTALLSHDIHCLGEMFDKILRLADIRSNVWLKLQTMATEMIEYNYESVKQIIKQIDRIITSIETECVVA